MAVKSTRRLLKPLLLLAVALVEHDPQARSQSPAPAPAETTIKARAQIVIVDVVVTDKNQNPVHNLKQSDFNVLEGSAPQTISHFEEHIYPNPQKPPAAPLQHLPLGVFTNFSPRPASDSVNIILLDSLNTPMADQAFVFSQLKKYLKTAQPGIRTAIFGMASHLILLQGFTSDPDILKSVLDKKLPESSPLLVDPTGNGDVTAVSTQFRDMMGSDPSAAEVIRRMEEFESETQAFQLQMRIGYTLEAMNLLARYLAAFPGRKNLIWFSGSFPFSVLPDPDLPNPFTVATNAEDELHQTASLLTSAQVAVYPIDARGIFTNPSFDASHQGGKYAAGNPNAFGSDQSKFFQTASSENDTMIQMAEQTGGRAFFNTNGLTQAIASAVDSGTNFYTLTYSPTTADWDGKFRKIQVHLQQQGYNLSYRRGYYAIDPNASAKARIKAPAPTPTPLPVKAAPAPLPPLDPMRTAMISGGPSPTQIIFKARILPATTTPEDSLAPGNKANPNAKLSHGPYRRYNIDIAADAGPILFSRSRDGFYHGEIEVRVHVFDQEGSLIVQSIANTHADVTVDTLRMILKNGFPIHQQISVPSKGAYSMRIGLHDITSDRLGAIEVPVATISNLPPLLAPTSPATAPR